MTHDPGNLFVRNSWHPRNTLGDIVATRRHSESFFLLTGATKNQTAVVTLVAKVAERDDQQIDSLFRNETADVAHREVARTLSRRRVEQALVDS